MRTDELADVVWIKSSRSGVNGNCVEVAFLGEGRVALRDSKDPEGPVLRFTRGEWSAFVDGVSEGELRTP
ncbi:DUF397 domain-containing protein [Kineosporia mesophila]|uniref:DUF397 domain-containing protein n=1 Tax=Kineosporia mesophila TaxID=566012 RepID=A0ABP7AGW7_9ACTN|nr:DUF397 domain-containing protein [Kineosporia mesophila]MCD5350854.1 DUF397 domain-containing protein [Kineosporia mesophila]